MKKLFMLMAGICLILAGCTKTADNNGKTDVQEKQETKEEIKEKKETSAEQIEEKKEDSTIEQNSSSDTVDSMESDKPEETVLTVEDVIQNPDAYVNTYVHVQGNLPQATGGMDENGNWILYFSGVNDINQHIRIINYAPEDGACLVEAYGTIVYLENGDLAISMDGYTIL